MAMNHVIMEEDLYDHDFVEKWCYGFDEWRERCSEWTPEKAAEVAWCDADDIRKAARFIATNGACAAPFGVSNDQKRNGVAAYQSIFNMLAITGNYENPGGNTIAYDPWGTVMSYVAGWDEGVLTPEMKAKRLGDKEFPLHSVGFSALGQPDILMKALETNNPPMRMSFCMGTNPFVNMAPDASRAYHALMNVDFAIACDYRMTPYIAGCVDLVLPIAMNWERNTLRCWFTPMRANRKYSTYYEAKSDEEDRGAARQQDEPRVLPVEGHQHRHGHGSSTSFSRLRTISGASRISTTARPTARTTTGPTVLTTSTRPAACVLTASPASPLRPVASSCGAPCSPTLALSLCPSTRSRLKVPSPRRSSSRSSRSSLPRVRATSSSSTPSSANRPICARRTPDPRVRINPEDAKELGVSDNAWVWIEGKRGRCRQRALITEGIMKGVVEADHGWWFPEQDGNAPHLFGAFDSNINNLTENCNPGPYSFGADFRSTLCKYSSLHAGEQRGHAWHRSRGERRFHEDSRIRQPGGRRVRRATVREGTNMSKMGLFINYDICFGCHACEMACSQEKKLPAGEFGIKIAQYGPHKNINGDWEYTYLPIPTKLCDLCAERTEIGKLPSCVHHCEAACMEYGEMEELSKRLVEQPRSVVFSLD